MSITVNNIVKSYGVQIALNKVTFEIESGMIVGLIGPNGAGKTTLMRIICGLLTPDYGEVSVNGTPVLFDSVEIRRKIGYLPENNPLYPEMYIREYLEYVANIYQSPKKNIDMVIELTGLNPEVYKRIGQLSKGYRQRVGLAQTLIHDPEILILDEPTTGLDPNQIIEIRDLISSVGIEKTIILSTHIMQEVEAICHRVIIINKGEIVANDATNNIKSIISETYQTVVVEFDKEIDEKKLLDIEGVERVKKIALFDWIIQSNTETDVRPKIFNLAVKNNLTVLSMQKKDKKLEDVFHELTSE